MAGHEMRSADVGGVGDYESLVCLCLEAESSSEIWSGNESGAADEVEDAQSGNESGSGRVSHVCAVAGASESVGVESAMASGRRGREESGSGGRGAYETATASYEASRRPSAVYEAEGSGEGENVEGRLSRAID